MKKLFFVSLICLALYSCQSKDNQFDVTVTLSGFTPEDGDHLILRHLYERTAIDSLPIAAEQSEYHFGVETTEEDAYILTINDQVIPHSLFIAQNEDVHEEVIIKDEGKRVNADVTITNDNEDDKEYRLYKDEIKPINDKLSALNNEYRELRVNGELKTPEQMEAFEMRYMTTVEEKENLTWDFVKNHKNLAGLVILNTDLKHDTNYDELKLAMENYPEKYHDSPLYQDTEDKLSRLKNIQIGAVAPNFSAPNPDGKMVSVEDFRGKVLLIDFWASWCGPCRQENPNLVKAYDQYKDKGFEILSVSYDSPGSREKWLNAVEQDHLTWTQVSNLKGWEDPTVSLYSIQGIPAPFLLDREGKIVAKHDEIRGDGLEEHLMALGL